MRPLREILLEREAELDAVEASLAEQQRRLDLEREELSKALIAIGVSTSESAEPSRRNSPRRASEKTIKKTVIEVLDAAGHGMTALDILAKVNAMLGVEYPRTSLSPQLSRLKADGYLSRDGVVWSLTDGAKVLGYPFPGQESEDDIEGEQTDTEASVAAE